MKKQYRRNERAAARLSAVVEHRPVADPLEVPPLGVPPTTVPSLNTPSQVVPPLEAPPLAALATPPPRSPPPPPLLRLPPPLPSWQPPPLSSTPPVWQAPPPPVRLHPIIPPTINSTSTAADAAANPFQRRGPAPLLYLKAGRTIYKIMHKTRGAVPMVIWKDCARAARGFFEAAALHDESSIGACAAYMVGLMYYDGDPDLSHDTAHFWFGLARNRGFWVYI